MSLKFTKEMFEDFSIYASPQEIAQAQFSKWLESQSVVYGQFNILSSAHDFGKYQMAASTHQARLVNIEPIEKPKCEHKLLKNNCMMGGPFEMECASCGKQLRATGWEEVK